ncbi:MAG TPA: carbamoyl-phosphate synthase subunit L, partial [Aquificaceae bacterium]|nr:carbamoyl-phosphate synthase subunit L [Aquificaceae bacterium]
IAEAFRRNYTVDEVYELTKIDKWFLYNIEEIVKFEEILQKEELSPEILREAKEMGYSDYEIAKIKGMTEEEVRNLRKSYKIRPCFKGVDTCAGEFVAYTPYYYSSYESPYYTIDGKEILDED